MQKSVGLVREEDFGGIHADRGLFGASEGGLPCGKCVCVSVNNKILTKILTSKTREEHLHASALPPRCPLALLAASSARSLNVSNSMHSLEACHASRDLSVLLYRY